MDKDNDTTNNTAKDMRTRFVDIISAGGVFSREDAEDTIHEINFQVYGDPSRHYRGLMHIRHMLETANDLDIQFKNPDAAFLATYFHELTFDVRRTVTNFTGDSCQTETNVTVRNYLTQANIDPKIIDETCRLIALSEHDVCDPEDHDGALFLDLRKVILGAERPQYQEYAYGSAMEFLEHFRPGDYQAGRSKFLEKSQARNQIFHTALFEERFAAQAHRNLAWEAKELPGIIHMAKHMEHIADLYPPKPKTGKSGKPGAHLN